MTFIADEIADSKENAPSVNSNTTYTNTIDMTEVDADVYKYTADCGGLHRIYIKKSNNTYDPTSYGYLKAELYYYASNMQIGSTIAVTSPEKYFTEDVYLEKGETCYFKIHGNASTYTFAINNAKVSSITLNAVNRVMEVNEWFTLTPSIAPEIAVNKEITYTSSNTNVAIVDQYGQIKTIDAGTAVITCLAADGSKVSSSCRLVVKPKKIAMNKQASKPLTTSSVKVAWNKQNGVSGYYVYQKATKDKSWKKIATIKSSGTTSYKAKKLKAGKNYQYRVTAYLQDGSQCYTSPVSDKITLKVIPGKVNKVTRKVEHNKNGSTSHTYKWKKVNGASGYEVSYQWQGTDYDERWSSWMKKYTTKLSSVQKYYEGDVRIKVRAYVVVNGKRYYGKFSKIK